ncbi:cytochrome P450 [Glycomyces arizonensis]|uniref:cytochrome P450 n=1 Tax=Glycomyces arizonensis TaxID=256035 RepID=UPI001B7F7D2C|nr:cytochrome P450 [Glycomyces arizonensis]
MTETMPHPAETDRVVRPSQASVFETLEVAARVVVPTVAVGVVKRRPLMMALAERFQVDRSAIRLLQRLRDDHGSRPLRLAVPGRTIVVLLSPDDVARVLAETPDPFSPDTVEKHAALGKFQPHGSLVSRNRPRRERRRFNEAVLEEHRPLHHLAAPMLARINEECDHLAEEAQAAGRLDWRRFQRSWNRLVRRVVFGDAAADDRAVTAALNALRRSANWAYLTPRREQIREALTERLREYLDRAESGTLAAAIAREDPDPAVHPADQVAHWLFAFDAAGMALMRTLALLAVNRGHRHVARCELGASAPDLPEELPYLRACVLESLRLWPTTPLLLRESTTETRWGPETLPEGTSFVIYTPLFHRDRERLPFADRFSPDVWTDGTAEADPALVPFSGGPARCPAENLTLFTVTSALARLLRHGEYRLASGHPLYTGRPEPATLDPFSLSFNTTAM